MSSEAQQTAFGRIPERPHDTADAILGRIAERLDTAAQGGDVEYLTSALEGIVAACAIDMTAASPDAINRVVFGLMSSLQPLVDRFGKAIPKCDADFVLRCAARIVRTFGIKPEDLSFDNDEFDTWHDSVAVLLAEIAIAVRLERIRNRSHSRGWGAPPADVTMH